jgi:hypothetical protein
MTIQVKETARIRDGRGHPPEILARFRRLLRDGATIKNDPKRGDFFELRCREEVFYFYLSPISGDVLLLAVWGNGQGRPRASAFCERLSAQADCPARP